MIPMPGLEVAYYAFLSSLGLAAFAIVLGALLYFLARRDWARGRSAAWPLRVAFAQAIAMGVWALLTWGAWGASLLAVGVAGAGYLGLASANERAGFSRPALLGPGLSGMLALLVALGLARVIVEKRRQAEAAMDAARTAEGRRAQDRFDALWVASPSRIAIVGTTSTPPSQDDDVWLCLLDALARQLSCEVWRTPGDQLGAAVVPLGEDWLVGGHSDDNLLFVRWSSKAEFRQRTQPSAGRIHALFPAGDGKTLVGGRSGEQAFLALFDDGGASAFWQPISTKVDSAAIVSIAAQGERFVAAGVDSVMGRQSFLVGGSVDEGLAWTKDLAPGPDLESTLCCVESDGRGLYRALGASRTRDGLEDLWSFRVDDAGTVTGERTFGEKLGETPGGLAWTGDHLILAAQRFTGAEDEFWLQAVRDDGQVAWSRTLQHRASGRAAAMERLPDGTLVVVGQRTTSSKSDGWIALLSGAGELLWQTTLP